tara:strand:- start:227 stop:460 length:234 start_codon:yes stop_codon:yes gene_type:complete
MNAFDPDFIHTYHADLIASTRASSKGSQAATVFAEKQRQKDPNFGTIRGLAPDFLRPKEFNVYARAVKPSKRNYAKL